MLKNLTLGKIFYSYNDQQLYVSHTLLFKLTNGLIPSFFQIHINDKKSRSPKNCVCTQFKRILKYHMKGFYLISREQNELNQAKELVKIIFDQENNHCKFCNKYNFTKVITL